MNVSAMIFAGVFMIFGLLLGYRLGHARSRMSYEEELRKVEAGRAALEAQLDQLRGSQPAESHEQPAGGGPSDSAPE